MKAFQIVLIIIFIALAIIGVLMFAGYIPSPKRSGRIEPVTLVVWGTMPSQKIVSSLDAFEAGEKVTLRYVEKSEKDLEVDLLRSIANNTTPDLILFSHELLETLKDNLFVIKDSSEFSVRDFKNIYIEGSEIFIDGTDMRALPVMVDPLVMYWNRDTFNEERITEPPKTWSQVINFSNTVTKRDSEGKILSSSIALGEADNITHFKDILSLLFLQTGDPIIQRGTDGTPSVLLATSRKGEDVGFSSAESALSFFTGFSDPVKRHYSWNTSLDISFDAFSVGDVALYLAPASEYEKIRTRNPLLNYDVAPVPQLEKGTDTTFGKIYALGIIKNSSHINEAFRAAFYLAFSNKDNATLFEDVFFLPSARRDVLAGGSPDPVMSVFYDGAIITRVWVDPDPVATENIFRKMVRDVSTNISNIGDAISSARNSLQNLVRKL